MTFDRLRLCPQLPDDVRGYLSLLHMRNANRDKRPPGQVAAILIHRILVVPMLDIVALPWQFKKGEFIDGVLPLETAYCLCRDPLLRL
jgi:hypothetical protein